MNKEKVLEWAELLETTEFKQSSILYKSEKYGVKSFCAVGLGATVLAGFDDPYDIGGYCLALRDVGIPMTLIDKAIKMNFNESFKAIAKMLRDECV